MAELTINGVMLAFDDEGAGRPAFVFIHGWASDRSVWSAQVAAFAADYRCIAVDLRGRGESQAVPPYGVGQALEDVAELIRTLNIAPVILVGHSLGGVVALAVNGRYPDLVRGTVTIDSPINAETGAGSPRSVAMIREAGSMHAVENFIQTFEYDPPNRAIHDYIATVMLKCPADVGAGMLEDLHLVGADMKRLLREADRKPFMMIWGERPLGDPAWVRDNTMFVRQEPVTGTGHFVQVEQPAVTNALLRAFLDDVAHDPRVNPTVAG
jgi:pimeloyl-ACP methyl ester carboxylesterase